MIAIGTAIGSLVKLRSIGADAKTAAEQVQPNHGSSMRDEVRQGFKRMDHQFGELKQEIHDERTERRTRDDQISNNTRLVISQIQTQLDDLKRT